jgi:hypothetical protein
MCARPKVAGVLLAPNVGTKQLCSSGGKYIGAYALGLLSIVLVRESIKRLANL